MLNNFEAQVREAEGESTTDEPQDHRRFYFIHNAMIELTPAEWMIRGILPKCGIVYDFGDPGSFKTFVALDRLLSIAAGISYHGHPVKQGTVFYIPGEGQQGIGRRITVWLIHHKLKAADVPFFVSSMPTQLMDVNALDEVKQAIDAMSKEYGAPAVVWFDTLSRNFGSGDENATKDVNQIIANLDSTFGNDFLIGISHHTGHTNKDRARGAMALHGAADAAFKISITTDDKILVECKKMKDAPATPPMMFERQEILLRIGDQDDHSFVLDLVAEGDDVLRGIKKTTRLTGAKRIALEALQKCLKGQTGPIHLDVWREAAYSVGITTSTEPDARQKAFKRAVAGLMDSRIITCEKDYYSVT